MRTPAEPLGEALQKHVKEQQHRHFVHLLHRTHGGLAAQSSTRGDATVCSLNPPSTPEGGSATPDLTSHPCVFISVFSQKAAPTFPIRRCERAMKEIFAACNSKTSGSSSRFGENTAGNVGLLHCGPVALQKNTDFLPPSSSSDRSQMWRLER